GVASRAAAPMQQAARNAVEPIANAASAVGQQVQGVASRAAALVQHSAGAAGHAALSASDQMGKLARSAGTSVRDALRGAAGKTESGLNRIGEGVSSRANQAGNQLKESAPGQKLVSAKEAALTQFENLGISRGKLAIPHQYGGCITMENGGKNNPIGNHLTGAIAKAYDRNERQNNALRNHVTIGQRDQTAAGPRIGR
ncbi:MAG: hypothetical protein KDK99_20000, partial [Verrucomicrobiales bacterium]|nr:hypothetical protein [Verrucomicrobiales bacterium]